MNIMCRGTECVGHRGVMYTVKLSESFFICMRRQNESGNVDTLPAASDDVPRNKGHTHTDRRKKKRKKNVIQFKLL